MRIEQTQKLKAPDFRRLVGVKRETFSKMIKILRISEREKRKKAEEKRNDV
jgi:hypothetical protein